MYILNGAVKKRTNVSTQPEENLLISLGGAQ